MASGIFLVQEDGSLIEMEEQEYPSEDHLQELLAKYPNLLAGNQIDDANPRRWLLISREVGLPAEENGSDRWSVDHLFLDQDAIPTLVEVKRSSDSRIRREVVGQMLDYAANAVVYWPIEEIRAKFMATCTAQNADPDETLRNFLNSSEYPETFWQKAKINLHAGKIRMLFVADEIPAELRRIVEFLNEQMDPAEVLAVEIKQYAGQKMRTLVPRVMGQVEKEPTEKKQWDRTSFFKSLAENCIEEEIKVADEILKWAESKGLSIRWGTGRISGTFSPILERNGARYYTITIWSNGSIAIEFMDLKKRPPFQDESKRLQLMARLNEIPGISISKDRIGGEPSIQLSDLKEEVVLKQFLETLNWLVEEIKAS